MARFLVAWEFGEDLGHLRRVLPLGRALRSRGHDVAFAFRDATRLDAPAREGFRAWPAPFLRRPGAFDPTPLNAADVLLNLGFRDAASLRGVQRAWDALIEAERPHAMVCDYAPNAMLAGARREIRRATVGSGFALPPACEPLAALRPGAATNADALRRVDDELRGCIAQAVGERASLMTLFRGEENLLTTWPELDPLGPRDADYLGPMAAAAEGLEVQWTAGSSRRVLAYLKPRDVRFDAILRALDALGAQAIVAAPGMFDADAARRSTAGVRIFAHALRLAPLLEGIDLCVGHGGPGFCADALRAGVPLLLLPMHLEQELVARRLVQQGLAAMHLADPSTLDAAVGQALADASLHERARAFARELADRPARDPAHEAAARIERLVS
jgi:hypothetical protein